MGSNLWIKVQIVSTCLIGIIYFIVNYACHDEVSEFLVGDQHYSLL